MFPFEITIEGQDGQTINDDTWDSSVEGVMDMLRDKYPNEIKSKTTIVNMMTGETLTYNA